MSRRQRRYDPFAILAYVAAYQQAHPTRSPSERHIQTALGISAPSVVHNLLRRLREAGLLRTTIAERGHVADHTVTPDGQTALAQWRALQGAAPPDA